VLSAVVLQVLYLAMITFRFVAASILLQRCKQKTDARHQFEAICRVFKDASVIKLQAVETYLLIKSVILSRDCCG
jgi:hypothetical protein